MLFRLDRYLSECDASLTRKSAKALLRDGSVCVNGEIVRDAARKINTDTDVVTVGGKPLTYVQFRYFTINKPDGVLSASRDLHARTVVDLIDGIGDDFFPVGRLDRDTDGLLIITNDGALAHELLSPRKHVPKTYLAVCRGTLAEDACDRLRVGVDLGDFTSAPAGISVLTYDEQDDTSVVAITITEGKFHQVKRMVAAVGSEVLKLRRVRMGGLWLPKDLAPGEYRENDGGELKKELFREVIRRKDGGDPEHKVKDDKDDEERLLRSYL
ncbi:MAG: rRNA pseudouridine synthase [Clostridia bacterium]|nr:rRNA pseudouridine synthase [Clostridia bacterium]